MTDTVQLQPREIVVSVDAHWLRRFAEDFLSAYRSFSSPESRYSPVPHFLVCRSIELSLKSFLRARGVLRNERKTIGHNLESALDKALDLGLKDYMEVTVEDREALAAANRLYRKKEFEYFESLDLVFEKSCQPDILPLADLAMKLVNAIEDPVREAAVEDSG